MVRALSRRAARLTSAHARAGLGGFDGLTWRGIYYRPGRLNARHISAWACDGDGPRPPPPLRLGPRPDPGDAAPVPGRGAPRAGSRPGRGRPRGHPPGVERLPPAPRLAARPGGGAGRSHAGGDRPPPRGEDAPAASPPLRPRRAGALGPAQAA